MGTRHALALSMMALALAGALTSVHASETVNDVTQLNPVVVEAVRTPTTVNEVSRLVAGHPGPVSIGGARHSQGGQSACAGCLFIDMRRLNRVLALDHRPSRRHLANRSRDA